MWVPILTVSHITLCIFACSLVACGGAPLYSEYFLVIDAGSTGSRLRMYEQTQRGMDEVLPSEEDEANFETEPGVSSYADKPDDAGPSLDNLLKAATKYVPESHRSRTRLWIKATAGMRLVPMVKLTPLLDSMDKYLNQTASPNSFKYMGSEVLGGEEEAGFAWISMNFVLGGIFDGYERTSGILDMGGASMQVAFNPGHNIMSNKFSFYVKNSRVSVYAKSYMQFGLSTAINRAMTVLAKKAGTDTSVVEYPCFQKGYSELVEIDGRQVNFTGTGNPVFCNDVVKDLLHLDYECLLQPCALMGVYMPKVKSWKKYYGLSNLFYIAHGLGLIGWGEAKSITPKAIFDETLSLCKMTLKGAQEGSKSPWKYKKKYCFGGFHMYHILVAFGFEDYDNNLVFARKINGRSADWSMGAALYETQFMPVILQSRDIFSANSAKQRWEKMKLSAMPLQKADATPFWLCTFAATLGLAVLAMRRRWSTRTNSLLDGVFHLEGPE